MKSFSTVPSAFCPGHPKTSWLREELQRQGPMNVTPRVCFFFPGRRALLGKRGKDYYRGGRQHLQLDWNLLSTEVLKFLPSILQPTLETKRKLRLRDLR